MIVIYYKSGAEFVTPLINILLIIYIIYVKHITETSTFEALESTTCSLLILRQRCLLLHHVMKFSHYTFLSVDVYRHKVMFIVSFFVVIVTCEE